MTFVNMERIEKRFNNQTVLRDVSLKMNRGEIVSIIGLLVLVIYIFALLRSIGND